MNSNDPNVTVVGPPSLSALNTDLLTGTVNGWFDADYFQSGSIHVIASAGISAGAITFEQANDPAAPAVALSAYEVALTNANPSVAAITIAANASRLFVCPINARYVRARISTAFVGGTVRAVGVLSFKAASLNTVNVQQATAANLNATVSGTVTANLGTGSLAAGTNAIGDVGVQYRANAGGGASMANVVSAATTNPTVVKASAGRVVGGVLCNTNAAIRFLKFHNTSAAPTAGAGVVATVPLPPNQPVNLEFVGGLAFATGISYTIVTGAAAADATAVGASEVTGFIAFA